MVCFDTINSVLMGGVIDGLRSYADQKGSCSLSKPLLAAQSETP